jgi:hypothetical protein
MDLLGILSGRLIDPGALTDQLLEQLEARFQDSKTLSALTDKSVEEFLATTLVNWLVPQTLEGEPSSTDSYGSGSDEPWDTMTCYEAEMRYQDALHRDMVLADALGACSNCWGERAECAICNGGGSPGWRRPNQHLHEILVQPAVRAARFG